MDDERLPFFVKDCALASISTGERAGSLIEFRDKLAKVDVGCLYFHFWSQRLHAQVVADEDNNDFAAWAHHYLHDHALAEKFGVIDPTVYKDLEDLRQHLLTVVEESIEDKEVIIWAKKERQFHFISSKIVVFDTKFVINEPEELPGLLPQLSLSSIFYHFVDARRRTAEGINDFSLWLKGFKDSYSSLASDMQSVDLYLLSLAEVRERLTEKVHDFFEHRVQTV